MKRSFFRYVSLNVLDVLDLPDYILADTLFVARRLGAGGLAALSLAIPVFGLINGLGLMLGIGGAARYAICRTQGDSVRTDRAFSRALACGGTLGGLLALAGLLWAVLLARLLGAEGAILPMRSVYLHTMLLFTPCFLLSHILTAFVCNDDNPKLAMVAMLLGSLSNIAPDYVFFYPMDMGIFGAALATGIAPIVDLRMSSLHILTRRSHFRLCPFRPALRPLADLVGLGNAAFLNECSSGLVLVIFNLLALRLAGTLGVAVYGIVANLALMTLALFTGTSQGVQSLASLTHGRGDAAGVRTMCRMTLGLALYAGLCMTALAFFAAGPLVSLLNRDGDPTLQQMAERGLRLYFLGFPFAGLNLVTASFLGAVEHPSRSFRLSLLRGFVAIVATALLLTVLLGLTGVWLAFPAAEGAVLLVSLRLSRSPRRAWPESAPRAITTMLRQHANAPYSAGVSARGLGSITSSWPGYFDR